MQEYWKNYIFIYKVTILLTRKLHCGYFFELLSTLVTYTKQLQDLLLYIVYCISLEILPDF